MQQVEVCILVGGQGSRLSLLSEHRAKPAVPFAGKYRIIDFTLTNCVYSGLFRVYLLTQYRPQSLMEHVGVGKPWDLDRKWGGVSFLHPALRYEGAAWYGGTADALVQNLDTLRDSDASEVLILSGDHVYKMNYEWLLKEHAEHNGDATVAVLEVPWELTRHFGVLSTDANGRIVDFEEKPEHAKSNLASMGVYAFKRRALIEVLEQLRREHANLDFGKHVLPHMIAGGRVQTYRYGGYWLDIGTVESYYAASMELLLDEPPLSLFDDKWHILTREHNRPPTRLEPSARVERSMVTDGCRIAGRVVGSVLGAGVIVEEGAQVIDSVLLDDCCVRRGAVVERVILDKRAQIGSEARVGAAGTAAANQEQPTVLACGVTIIGKDAHIPRRQVIGRNCLIDMLAGPEDFPGHDLPDGAALRTHRVHHPVR